MFIAEAARRAGTSPATLRYYQRIGLIPRVARRQSGYREFVDADVRVLRFIKRAQALGFTLDEVKQLLDLRRVRPARRNAVRAIAVKRLEDVSQRIDDLVRVKKAIEALVSSCAEGATPQCPILEALDLDEETCHD